MKGFKGWLSAKDKPLRRVLFGVVIAAVAAGVIWGGLTLLKTARRAPVNVYPVDGFAMTDYWGDSAETYGTVTTDKLQKIFISNTQSVKQVYVEEGQTVRKGDRLIAYDTTLGDLDLQRAQIAVERAQLALTAAQDELKVLQANNDVLALSKAKSELEVKLQKAKDDYGSYTEGTPTDIPCGIGVKSSPRYVDAALYTLASHTDVPDIAKLGRDFLPAPKTEAYVVLVTVRNGSYTDYRGLHLLGDGTGNAAGYEEFAADSLAAEGASSTAQIDQIKRQLNEVQNLLDKALSTVELIQRQNEQKQLISEKEVSVKLAQMDLKAKQKEVSDGVVYSEIDGTVKAVRDAKEAYTAGQAVVEVSGGGGYYVTGAISELALDTVAIGQTVQINSWQTGAMCEGQVVEVGVYPTNANGWSDGNNNVSWYPLKVFVSEEANLQEGDGVSMTYQASGDANTDAWYLQSMFIRNESGRSYVMVRGADDKLEQRFIQTGRDLWGSYTQITGGELTLDDFVAFPYGQDTVAGAQTTESTMDDFYMSAY